MEFLGLGLGLGLIVVGAAFGIGKLGAAATESMARQPEVAGKISTAAIILAALIEGFTFFAIITDGGFGDKAAAAKPAAEVKADAKH
ncbi:MAG: ATP synthase F0 subunit C [Planctomycetota bacterium]